jgi:putative endonuclease
MLKCTTCRKRLTYVGYTNNLKTRILQHNSGKGAKFTKGNLWKIIYKKKFLSKSNAMKYEYLLKKNQKIRTEIFNKS